MNKSALKRLEEQDTQAVAQQFFDITKKTDKDNPTSDDVKALRQCLADYPFLWRYAGDLAMLAAHDIVRSVESSSLLRESLRSGWHALKDELGYRDSPPLEQLLIEQVALCWLRLNLLEYQYTNIASKSIPTLDFWDRRLAASQRRYMRACETLARVRRIIRRTPALQINIATQGGRQINVANASSAP